MPKNRLHSCLLGLLAFFSMQAHALDESNPCAGKTALLNPVISSQSGDEGIGGTGLAPVAAPETLAKHSGDGEEGIGGTGIVGVIAGFGSICVNGQEIHYDAHTPTLENGSGSNTRRLALGQTVAVLAQAIANGYTAREIHVLYEVQGPVEAIDRQQNQLMVLGQVVRLPAGVASTYSPGQMLSVSGNRLPDGSILAWRLEHWKTGAEVSLIGPATQISGDRIQVGSQVIQLPEAATSFRAGSDVMVRGYLRAGVLQASAIKENPRITAFNDRVDHLVVQGYVRASGGGKVDIDGMQFNASPLPHARWPTPGERIDFEINKGSDGLFRIDRWRHQTPDIERPLGKTPDDARALSTNPLRENARAMDGDGPRGNALAEKPELFRQPLRLETQRPEIPQRPDFLRPPRGPHDGRPLDIQRPRR